MRKAWGLPGLALAVLAALAAAEPAEKGGEAGQQERGPEARAPAPETDRAPVLPPWQGGEPGPAPEGDRPDTGTDGRDPCCSMEHGPGG